MFLDPFLQSGQIVSHTDKRPGTAGAHSSSKLFILPNRIDLGFFYTYVTQVQVLLCQEIEPRTAETLALAV